MDAIQCRVAETRREVDDALRVRWAVFGEELGLVPRRPARREVDDFDLLESTLHVVAYAGGAAVATGRLLLPSQEVARARGRGVGIELEGRFDLGPLSAPGAGVAEATRVCVLRPFRRAGTVEALILAMIEESRRRGVTHWVAAANTETDVAEDASIVAQLCEQRGLLSRYRLIVREEPSPPSAPCAPLFDGERRRRAAAGDLSGMALPRPIESFTRMGARLAGPAVYDARFQRFAAPLVTCLDEATVLPAPRRAA